MFFGVAAGLADYFEIDPVLVRVALAVSVLFTGLGLVAYLLLVFLMPSGSADLET